MEGKGQKGLPWLFESHHVTIPRTFASTLESLDLRITALEQWRATADPADPADPDAGHPASAPTEEAPVEPPQTTPEERGWVRVFQVSWVDLTHL